MVYKTSRFVETVAMKQRFEVKTKRASAYFEARLKPLCWSSPIDLRAAGAGGKNPAFGLLAAIYVSENQDSL
jgi:hypothetical protein